MNNTICLPDLKKITNFDKICKIIENSVNDNNLHYFNVPVDPPQFTIVNGTVIEKRRIPVFCISFQGIIERYNIAEPLLNWISSDIGKWTIQYGELLRLEYHKDYDSLHIRSAVSALLPIKRITEFYLKFNKPSFDTI